jgi:predicted nucleotidyltransferase component of viral defense system
VDLDFNHIGPKDKVLQERQTIRKQVCKLLEKQDSACVINSKHRYEQTTIKARYKTLANTPQSIKIEISHIERFPILPPLQKQLRTPTGAANVTTYTLEELASTKLRALVERNRGRDIYDLYFISKLKPNSTVIRKMFLYYFYRSRKVFNPKIHYKNLTNRYENGTYTDDVSDFVKPTVPFDLRKGAKEVISYYTFINELDKLDKDFLQLASMLLGRRIPKQRIEQLQKVEKPLNLLFDGIKISQEASAISTNEIRLFEKRKRRSLANPR